MIQRPASADELPAKAKITLRDNMSGDTRSFIDDWTGEHSAKWDWKPTLSNVFWYWTEGNSSCDCNRALHFGAPTDHDMPCCDEDMGGNRYTLIGFEPG